MSLPLYARIAHKEVEAFAHDEIQGEPVPVDESPFAPGAPDLFRLFGEEDIESSEDTRLIKISELHGRSYALPWTVYWQDRYGNLFSALNAKGNNATNPKLSTQFPTPSGFCVHGLQDGHALVRMLRASRVLRKNSVPTELMVRVLEPAALPSMEREYVPVPQFKTQLVERAMREQHGDIPSLVDAVRTMVFFITIRGVQVNERVADLNHAKTDDERRRMLEAAFRFFNEEARMKATRDGLPLPAALSPENDADIDRFLHTILPIRAAENIAKMHLAGLWHVYPHTGNVSLIGSIYDLDSVRGVPLGLDDEPINEDRRWSDVDHFLNNLKASGDDRTAFDPRRFRHAFLTSYAPAFYAHDPILAAAASSVAGINADASSSRMQARCILAERIANMYTQKVAPHIDAIRATIREHKGEEITPSEEASLLCKIIDKFMVAEYDDAESAGCIMIRQFSQTMANKFTGAEPPDERQLLDLEEGPLLHRIVTIVGYEEDVVRNAVKISSVFDDFMFMLYRPEFQYYFAKVFAQLGWEPQCEISIEELIEQFHQADDEDLRTHIATAVREAPPDKQSEAALAAIDSFAMIHDPGARYCDFMIDMTRRSFGSSIEAAAVLGRIRATYGKEVEEKIAEWIESHWWHVYHEDVPDEEQEEKIIRVADARVAQLRSMFGTSNATDTDAPSAPPSAGAGAGSFVV